MRDLASEQVAYQQALEALRLHPEDDELAEDLQKACAAVEVAWLERMVDA